MEDACEMYARAANMFKMAKNWSGMHKAIHVYKMLEYLIFSYAVGLL